MSGEHSFNQLIRFSIRCRTELTFQVAMRIGPQDFFQVGFLSDRKAGAAAAGGGRVGIVDAERGADQIVDEIDLRARQERHRGGIDENDRAVTGNHQIILGAQTFDVELVLKAGAAAALDADPQHGAVALAFEDFADTAGGPLADGDACGHRQNSDRRCTAYLSGNRRIIAKCCGQGNQTGLPVWKQDIPCPLEWLPLARSMAAIPIAAEDDGLWSRRAGPAARSGATVTG